MAIIVTFGNLETGESMACQYAPTELKEKIAVNYERLKVPGLSHAPLQYINTENHVVDVEFDFNQLVNPSVKIDDARRFFLSLCYPLQGASSVTTGSPPRVFFFWPGLFAMTCRVSTIEWTHTWFDRSGAPAMYRMKPSFEEARVTRLTSGAVRDAGTIRSA